MSPGELRGSAGLLVAHPVGLARHVSAGANHVCGVTADDRAWCWGYGGDGELGNGSSSEVPSTPKLVAGGRSWRHVRAGFSGRCRLNGHFSQ
jgi:alpha-tubulin suppressor-like RCC1 family protein